MRVIKFRAKSLHTGEWHYGDLVQPSDNAVFIQERGTAGFFSDPNTVGQFIELLDKNGKEIYEGDILDFNGLNIEVRFVRGVFALLCNGDLDQELCGDCRTDLFSKIIGNIHDNPELLKGGNDE